MPDEVAVFVDFENLRYGLLNNYGQEPDIQILLEKAKTYGRPTVMRGYADFTEHPEELRRQLQVGGFEAINVPVKRSISAKGGKQLERVKNAADMVLALDAIMEAIEADRNQKIKVFLIVAGDADYVKLVTLLRNRFGQRVVICGVPGSIARDLVTAAGEEDHIDVPASITVDDREVKQAVVSMVKKGPAPLQFWTLKVIDQWSQNPRNDVPGRATQRRDCIGQLVEESVLIKRETQYQGKTVIETVLDESKAKDQGYLR